jgi:thioredoxin 1
MEKTFTDATFDADVLKETKPVFVDFWAPWCGPCRTMAPVVEELAKELEGKAVIGKLNVDENIQTANAFNVQSIPTFLIFKNGKVVGQYVGVKEKSELKEAILKQV